MGTGCLPKSNTLVEEQVFVFRSIPQERMPSSTTASVGGWPELPGECLRCCGHNLASPPSLAPPGSPRLVWGPSQALKPHADHSPSPDTLPGPGSGSQPRSRSAPAWCSWPPWQAVLATLLQGTACPSQPASRIIISFFTPFCPCICSFFPVAAVQTPAQNTRSDFHLPFQAVSLMPKILL